MKTRVLAGSFAVVSVAALALLAPGCGDDTTTNSTANTTDSTGSSGDDVCRPENIATCDIARTVPSDCLALADYSNAATTTLRIAQLKILTPATLGTNPLVQGTVVDGAVTINLPDCNLGDSDPASTYGNFNMLLQFDFANMKLKAGGAHPTLNPLGGYSFANETIGTGPNAFKVEPIELDLTMKGDTFEVTTGVDLTLPIYQDKQAKEVILLPLHKTTITKVKFSADHNCIGSLDFANLHPEASCKLAEPYIGGATLDGYITLEEADLIVVKEANTTLCALLAGELGMTNCTRTGADIAFKGNWCSTTNMANGCQDAVKLSAEFEAAAVKVNN